MKKTIVIATIHPWNIAACRRWKAPRGYRKVLITGKSALTYDRLKKLNPRYVFFPHWSWIIPQDIYGNFECVVFHMTDLPFGRGGSPMQNLIVRGIYKTKVSAIRVEAGLDTGPVYLKKPFDVSQGSAERLFGILAGIVCRMMTQVVVRKLRPRAQRGAAVEFRRRKLKESALPAGLTGRKLYDFIRMLDAPGYPNAFVDTGAGHIRLRKAALNKDGTVIAEASFE